MIHVLHTSLPLSRTELLFFAAESLHVDTLMLPLSKSLIFLLLGIMCLNVLSITLREHTITLHDTRTTRPVLELDLCLRNLVL